MELKIARKAAAVFLFAMFPGFFFYYSLVAFGTINALPVGYFGSVCVISLMILGALHASSIAAGRKIRMHGLFLSTIILTLLVVGGFNYTFNDKKEIFFWHAQAAIEFAAAYFIFRYAALDSKRLQLALMISCAGISAIVLSNIYEGQFYLRNSSDLDVSLPSYQGFGLSIFVTFFCITSPLTKAFARISLHLTAIVLLYLNGARSELAAYLVYASVLEYLISRYKSFIIFLVFSSIAIAALSFIFLDFELEGNRVTRLLTPSEDTSLSARQVINEFGWKTIMSSPLTGEYGNYEPGEYMHNVFSSWVDLGIAGPILMALVIIYLCRQISYLSNALERKHEASAAIALLASCMLLLLASKYFLYLPLAMLCGYVSRVSVQSQSILHRTS